MNYPFLLAEADAMKFVQDRHGNKTYGDYPYFFHLYQVVAIAKEFGFGKDEDIIIALWLHDIMEDADVNYNEIKQKFGLTVAEIVYAVTDHKGRNRKERHRLTYPEIRATNNAPIVKACDRLGNIRFGIATANHSKTKMYFEEQGEFYTELTKDRTISNGELILWMALQGELEKAMSRRVEYPSE